MGIISEELPEHLQLQIKDKLSQPDWPSIFGTFWASLKALWDVIQVSHKSFQKSIQEINSKVEKFIEESRKELKSSIQEINQKFEIRFAESHKKWIKFIKETDHRIDNSQKERNQKFDKNPS